MACCLNSHGTGPHRLGWRRHKPVPNLAAAAWEGHNARTVHLREGAAMPNLGGPRTAAIQRAIVSREPDDTANIISNAIMQVASHGVGLTNGNDP